MPLTKNFSSSRYFSPALPLPVETIRGQAMLEIQGRFRAAVAGSIAGAILLYLIFFFTAWLNDTALDAVLAMFICVLGAIGGWLAGLGYEIHQVIREQREKAYRTLIEYAPDGIGLCQEERLIWLNPVACRLFGVTSSRQFQHKTLSEFVAPENHTLLAGYTEQIHQGIHLPAWIGVELKRPDATRMEVRLHLAVLENYPGARLMLVIVRELSDYRALDEKLRQAGRVFDSISEAILITDAAHEIRRANPAFTRITGYREGEVQGRTPTFLQVSEEAELYRLIEEALGGSGEWHGELQFRRKNGEVFPLLAHISALRDSHGEVVNYVHVFSDITRLKRSEEKLEYLTYHDPLTGLPNRVLFMAHLQHILEHLEQHKQPRLAILWVDIDRFKHINSTLGHVLGDILLKEAAQRLHKALDGCQRPYTLARPGDDEFAVILEDLPDAEYAALLAQSMLDSFATPLKMQNYDIVLSAGIGISLYPEDGLDSETLLQAVDNALNRAKREGGAMYQFCTLGMRSRLQDTITLGNSLKRAIENQELVLYYQPQVDLKTRRIISAEAVLRWQHPKRGLLAPAKFIPYAEETGLIVGLSEWALRAACSQNKQWQSAGFPPIRIGVNLTARQIAGEHTIEKITAMIHESRLTPEWLTLEVTESLIIQNPAQAILNMHALKKLGVTLSIDDFGTGYSSFSYLKELPVDELKIDRVFIKDLPQSSRDAKITSAMIAIGHNLQLSVVAKGVETEAQLEFLKARHCDVIQGYLFSHPVPADKFARLFKANFWQPV